jgi:uncharacterized membrane-anchored protein YitT (DUF2179 family)
VKGKLKIATSYVIVLIVALVMAVNYQLFVFPNSFAPAGVNGLLTMIQYVLGIKLSFASIVINIPLALVCFLLDNKTRALRSLTYSVAFSVFLALLENLDLSKFVYSTTISAFLGPAVAGLISGACGYVMHSLNGHLGGTEFVATLIHRKKPSFNFFSVVFALNVAVAVISYFVYDYQIEPVLLCIIYCYFSTAVRDNMNRKYKSAVRCEIITENPQELCDAVIHELHHSATIFPAKGAFTGKDKSVIVCIVNPSQVTELTRLVTQFPGSFVALSQISNVIGNFKRLDSHGNRPVEVYDSGKNS